ncbi:unnamed protein product [Amoebophrya sp. A25]|nr:unnamed protein product [Amoebophrya sp. A25]|eukprot:GSA25T00011985001.1
MSQEEPRRRRSLDVTGGYVQLLGRHSKNAGNSKPHSKSSGSQQSEEEPRGARIRFPGEAARGLLGEANMQLSPPAARIAREEPPIDVPPPMTGTAMMKAAPASSGLISSNSNTGLISEETGQLQIEVASLGSRHERSTQLSQKARGPKEQEQIVISGNSTTSSRSAPVGTAHQPEDEPSQDPRPSAPLPPPKPLSEALQMKNTTSSKKLLALIPYANSAVVPGSNTSCVTTSSLGFHPGRAKATQISCVVLSDEHKQLLEAGQVGKKAGKGHTSKGTAKGTKSSSLGSSSGPAPPGRAKTESGASRSSAIVVPTVSTAGGAAIVAPSAQYRATASAVAELLPPGNTRDEVVACVRHWVVNYRSLSGIEVSVTDPRFEVPAFVASGHRSRDMYRTKQGMADPKIGHRENNIPLRTILSMLVRFPKKRDDLLGRLSFTRLRTLEQFLRSELKAEKIHEEIYSDIFQKHRSTLQRNADAQEPQTTTSSTRLQKNAACITGDDPAARLDEFKADVEKARKKRVHPLLQQGVERVALESLVQPPGGSTIGAAAKNIDLDAKIRGNQHVAFSDLNFAAAAEPRVKELNTKATAVRSHWAAQQNLNASTSSSSSRPRLRSGVDVDEAVDGQEVENGLSPAFSEFAGRGGETETPFDFYNPELQTTGRKRIRIIPKSTKRKRRRKERAAAASSASAGVAVGSGEQEDVDMDALFTAGSSMESIFFMSKEKDLEGEQVEREVKPMTKVAVDGKKNPTWSPKNLKKGQKKLVGGDEDDDNSSSSPGPAEQVEETRSSSFQYAEVNVRYEVRPDDRLGRALGATRLVRIIEPASTSAVLTGKGQAAASGSTLQQAPADSLGGTKAQLAPVGAVNASSALNAENATSLSSSSEVPRASAAAASAAASLTISSAVPAASSSSAAGASSSRSAAAATSPLSIVPPDAASSLHPGAAASAAARPSQDQERSLPGVKKEAKRRVHWATPLDTEHAVPAESADRGPLFPTEILGTAGAFDEDEFNHADVAQTDALEDVLNEDRLSEVGDESDDLADLFRAG